MAAGDDWQRLSQILVPLIKFTDGTKGCVIADMAVGDASEKHVLGFLARSDAEQARYLMQANLDEGEAQVDVVPMTPEELQMRASELECDVTVYRSGQLQLKPGMTLEQILQAAVAAR